MVKNFNGQKKRKLTEENSNVQQTTLKFAWKQKNISIRRFLKKKNNTGSIIISDFTLH